METVVVVLVEALIATCQKCFGYHLVKHRLDNFYNCLRERIMIGLCAVCPVAKSLLKLQQDAFPEGGLHDRDFLVYLSNASKWHGFL